MVARILVLLALFCAPSSSFGFTTTHVCTLENGRKVRVDLDDACRAVVTPTPEPTASPKPTVVADCSDGRFVRIQGVNVLQFVNRAYEPGREYHLCADMPVPNGRPMGLSSNNQAKASCNVLRVVLRSPSGKEYTSEAPYPGVGMVGETGVWSLTLWRDPNPLTSCAKNFPFDLYLDWF